MLLSKKYFRVCSLLKLRNLEGVSGEKQKLSAAEQAGRVLKKQSCKASFLKNCKTLGYEQDIFLSCVDKF
jgi:hypothetical protein